MSTPDAITRGKPENIDPIDKHPFQDPDELQPVYLGPAFDEVGDDDNQGGKRKRRTKRRKSLKKKRKTKRKTNKRKSLKKRRKTKRKGG